MSELGRRIAENIARSRGRERKELTREQREEGAKLRQYIAKTQKGPTPESEFLKKVSQSFTGDAPLSPEAQARLDRIGGGPLGAVAGFQEQLKANREAEFKEMAEKKEEYSWPRKVASFVPGFIGGAAHGVLEVADYAMGGGPHNLRAEALEQRRNAAFDQNEQRLYFLRDYAEKHGEEAAKALDEADREHMRNVVVYQPEILEQQGFPTLRSESEGPISRFLGLSFNEGFHNTPIYKADPKFWKKLRELNADKETLGIYNDSFEVQRKIDFPLYGAMIEAHKQFNDEVQALIARDAGLWEGWEEDFLNMGAGTIEFLASAVGAGTLQKNQTPFQAAWNMGRQGTAGTVGAGIAALTPDENNEILGIPLPQLARKPMLMMAVLGPALLRAAKMPITTKRGKIVQRMRKRDPQFDAMMRRLEGLGIKDEGGALIKESAAAQAAAKLGESAPVLWAKGTKPYKVLKDIADTPLPFRPKIRDKGKVTKGQDKTPGFSERVAGKLVDRTWGDVAAAGARGAFYWAWTGAPQLGIMHPLAGTMHGFLLKSDRYKGMANWGRRTFTRSGYQAQTDAELAEQAGQASSTIADVTREATAGTAAMVMALNEVDNYPNGVPGGYSVLESPAYIEKVQRGEGMFGRRTIAGLPDSEVILPPNVTVSPTATARRGEAPPLKGGEPSPGGTRWMARMPREKYRVQLRGNSEAKIISDIKSKGAELKRLLSEIADNTERELAGEKVRVKGPTKDVDALNLANEINDLQRELNRRKAVKEAQEKGSVSIPPEEIKYQALKDFTKELRKNYDEATVRQVLAQIEAAGPEAPTWEASPDAFTDKRRTRDFSPTDEPTGRTGERPTGVGQTYTIRSGENVYRIIDQDAQIKENRLLMIDAANRAAENLKESIKEEIAILKQSSTEGRWSERYKQEQISNLEQNLRLVDVALDEWLSRSPDNPGLDSLVSELEALGKEGRWEEDVPRSRSPREAQQSFQARANEQAAKQTQKEAFMFELEQAQIEMVTEAQGKDGAVGKLMTKLYDEFGRSAVDIAIREQNRKARKVSEAADDSAYYPITWTGAVVAGTPLARLIERGSIGRKVDLEAEIPKPRKPESPAARPWMAEDKPRWLEGPEREQLLKDILKDGIDTPSGDYLFHTTDVDSAFSITKEGGFDSGGVTPTPFTEWGYGDYVVVFRRKDLGNVGDGGDVALVKSGFTPADPIATFTMSELGVSERQRPLGARASEMGVTDYDPPEAYEPRKPVLETVEIKYRDGAAKKEAAVIGNWAVHKGLASTKREPNWTVTHLPTGMRLPLEADIPILKSTKYPGEKLLKKEALNIIQEIDRHGIADIPDEATAKRAFDEGVFNRLGTDDVRPFGVAKAKPQPKPKAKDPGIAAVLQEKTTPVTFKRTERSTKGTGEYMGRPYKPSDKPLTERITRPGDPNEMITAFEAAGRGSTPGTQTAIREGKVVDTLDPSPQEIASFRRGVEAAEGRAAQLRAEKDRPKPPGVKLPVKNKFTAKDQAKSDKATKFIGKGSKKSSTNAYAKAWGELANTGKYSSYDTVFVSAEGKRKGRVKLDEAELGKALAAKATIITDTPSNRKRDYNIGEREIASFLTEWDYKEVAPGTWKAPTGITKRKLGQATATSKRKLTPEELKAQKEAGFVELTKESKPLDTPVHWGKGQNKILSNFADAPFTFRGKKFKTAEGAYQAHKSGRYVHGFQELSGKAAKSKGHGKDVDKATNLDLMREILSEKYNQVPAFKKALDSAGKITHPVGDAFWRDNFPPLLEELKGKRVEAFSEKNLNRLRTNFKRIANLPRNKRSSEMYKFARSLVADDSVPLKIKKAIWAAATGGPNPHISKNYGKAPGPGQPSRTSDPSKYKNAHEEVLGYLEGDRPAEALATSRPIQFDKAKDGVELGKQLAKDINTIETAFANKDITLDQRVTALRDIYDNIIEDVRQGERGRQNKYEYMSETGEQRRSGDRAVLSRVGSAAISRARQTGRTPLQEAAGLLEQLDTAIQRAETESLKTPGSRAYEATNAARKIWKGDKVEGVTPGFKRLVTRLRDKARASEKGTGRPLDADIINAIDKLDLPAHEKLALREATKKVVAADQANHVDRGAGYTSNQVPMSKEARAREVAAVETSISAIRTAADKLSVPREQMTKNIWDAAKKLDRLRPKKKAPKDPYRYKDRVYANLGDTVVPTWLAKELKKTLNKFEELGMSKTQRDAYQLGQMDIWNSGLTLITSEKAKVIIGDKVISKLESMLDTTFDNATKDRVKSQLNEYLDNFNMPFTGRERMADYSLNLPGPMTAMGLLEVATRTVPDIFHYKGKKGKALGAVSIPEALFEALDDLKKAGKKKDIIEIQAEAFANLNNQWTAQTKVLALNKIRNQEMARFGIDQSMTKEEIAARIVIRRLVHQDAMPLMLPDRATKVVMGDNRLKYEAERITAKDIADAIELDPEGMIKEIKDEITNLKKDGVLISDLTRKDIRRLREKDGPLQEIADDLERMLTKDKDSVDSDLNALFDDVMTNEEKATKAPKRHDVREGESLVDPDLNFDYTYNESLTDSIYNSSMNNEWLNSMAFDARILQDQQKSFSKFISDMKGNVTYNSLLTNVGNLAGHSLVTGLLTGEMPTTFYNRVAREAWLYKKYSKNESAFVEQYGRKMGPRIEAYDAIKNYANIQNLDFASVESSLPSGTGWAGVGSGLGGLGAKSKAYQSYRALRRQIYQLEDNGPRLAETVREYIDVTKELDALKPGEFRALPTGKQGMTIVERRSDGYLYRGKQNLSANAKEFKKLKVSYAVRKVSGRIFNYNEVPRFIKMARANKLGAAGLLISPFLSFPYLAVDIPGFKKGVFGSILGDNLTGTSGYTNSPAVMQKMARREAVRSLRVLRWGLAVNQFKHPLNNDLDEIARFNMEPGSTTAAMIRSSDKPNTVGVWRWNNANVFEASILLLRNILGAQAWLADKALPASAKRNKNVQYYLHQRAEGKVNTPKDVVKILNVTGNLFSRGIMSAMPKQSDMDKGSISWSLQEAMSSLAGSLLGVDDWNAVKTALPMLTETGVSPKDPRFSAFRPLIRDMEETDQINWDTWTTQQKMDFMVANWFSAFTRLHLRERPIYGGMSINNQARLALKEYRKALITPIDDEMKLRSGAELRRLKLIRSQALIAYNKLQMAYDTFYGNVKNLEGLKRNRTEKEFKEHLWMEERKKRVDLSRAALAKARREAANALRRTQKDTKEAKKFRSLR